MDEVLIYIVILCWVISSLYVMRWHYQRGDLYIGTILMAIMLAPILAIIVRDNEKELKKQRGESENDRHRRWFRTMGEINRQSIPNYGRTIPPPSPISRRGPSHVELNMAERIRLENEREKNKLKNFKFLKG